MSNSVEKLLVGAALIHADRRTDSGGADTAKKIGTYCAHSRAPKTNIHVRNEVLKYVGFHNILNAGRTVKIS